MTSHKDKDHKSLIPNFGWIALKDEIKQTFHSTTHYAHVLHWTDLQKTFESLFPALNVPRSQEDVATDTIFSDVPAIDSGDTMAQFCCGTKSLLCDVYSMKPERQMINTLEDIIRQHGAPDSLLIDQLMSRQKRERLIFSVLISLGIETMNLTISIRILQNIYTRQSSNNWQPSKYMAVMYGIHLFSSQLYCNCFSWMAHTH